ncbi:MAG: helix-turn-helix domain-containing protein [Firmicutes bacterium]|nr:helix-turn-helix domain-containing protein [Bacillota bacterium]
MELFPVRLRKLREDKKLILEELAEELCISKSLLWDLEQGRRRVHGELLFKIALYFKVSTDYLLGLSDGQNEKNDAPLEYYLDPEITSILTRSKELSPKGKEQLRRAVEWVFEVDERERKTNRDKD